MSRTRKGAKAPGFDFGAPRPGNRHYGGGSGKIRKRITHKIERQQNKAAPADIDEMAELYSSLA